ncbi:HIT domain-containing protein [Actinomadura sp. KC345]|uniref:HIT family protein n=1 Tax=Actinomadura sp. KC345 TaxID=2530371 RepID=UPI00104C86B6|nr:HIT domain-containing protein [Actinomadura sp. KC345]TDC57622.1 HIT domain-containing protein [Actinomadura sp. KC345]
MAEPTVWSEPGPECVLCPPLRFRFNAMAGLPGETGVIARDAAFLLMPDVAPLAEGHVLLVTREHHQCAGAFGRAMWERAMSWRDRVARLYREAYGDGALLLFEHGPASAQGGGACIDHAHWHLLPGTHGVRAVVEQQGLPGAPAGHTALRAYFRTGRSYLLIEEDGVATVHPGDGVRSQFLRWAVTAGAGDETWRWQETFGLPGSRRRFLRTLRALRAAVGPEAEAVPRGGHVPESHQ